MPAQLRTLFATICLQCSPTNPLQLWMDHKAAMMEDFLRHEPTSVNTAEQKALQHISSIFDINGENYAASGLPDINPNTIINELEPHGNREIAQAKIDALNVQQKTFVVSVLSHLDEIRSGAPHRCRAHFLDGPGGSGKTTVYNTLHCYFSSIGLKTATCAWTGIAATLLFGGRTTHNLFKLPVPILDTSVCRISPTSTHAAYLRTIDIFILDEASMIPVHALSAIDRMLRDITDIDVPFGGKIFVLGGDFRQVLPVLPKKPRSAIVENCLKSSPLWSVLDVHKLTQNMRAGFGESEFAEWLLRLGNGTISCTIPGVPPETIEIPPRIHMVEGNIVDHVFDDVSQPELLTDTVILTPTNNSSLQLNDEVLHKLPGNPTVYLSADEALSEEDVSMYPVEFINSITPSVMPPHKLMLKEGAIIMLLRNLDIRKGLCNGTRLIIRRLHRHVIDAEILTRSGKGERVLIPRIKLAPSDVALPFTLQRIQFPVRLPYSMTINKSQGQTFNKLGIFLESPVFSHGQLYVAFSRAKRFEDIYVKMTKSAAQNPTTNTTVNVVFTEVL